MHAATWYLALMVLGLASVLIGFFLHLMPANWTNLPWLDNYQTPFHIDDKGDRWRTYKDLIIKQRNAAEGNFDELKDESIISYDIFLKSSEKGQTYKQLTGFGFILETSKRLVFSIAFLFSISMNIYTFFSIGRSHSFEYWACLGSTFSNSLIALFLLTMVCKSCSQFQQTPFLSNVYVPFVLSCSVQSILDTDLNQQQQDTVIKGFLSILGIYFMLHATTLMLSSQKWMSFNIITFLRHNFVTCTGSYKKCIRLFDTLGSLCGLLGLVIGMTSLFCDQYDLEFEPTGELKSVMDHFDTFLGDMRNIADDIMQIIKKLDIEITCDRIYEVLGGGTLLGLLASLVPGGNFVISTGTRSTYYIVNMMSAMKKVAAGLASSLRAMWGIAKITNKLGILGISNFNKFTIGGSSISLLRLLPFLPPVVIGIHILFSSFWPQRILFFSASQRRMFMDSQKQHWISVLFLLVLAFLINTVLITELQRVFNESLPFLDVHINWKLGWKLSVAASAFAMASAVSYFITYSILGSKTYMDHDNLTNEEVEWKNFVESKKKTTYCNAFGAKVEWKNQIKYKKERIGGWTWVLPICLCLLACSLGVLANLYPKIDIVREPKGTFVRAIDELTNKIKVFETEKKTVIKLAEEECLPFPTFLDVLSENMDLTSRMNLLTKPVHEFFNETEKLVGPLRDIAERTRKQFVSNVGDQLFGEEVGKQIRDFNKLDLQYLGMLLLIPRAIQLITLVLGMLSMSYATCQMEIIPSVEPRKIVRFFGCMCMFSFVYCICTQIAIFNVLTDFGIPFYR